MTRWIFPALLLVSSSIAAEQIQTRLPQYDDRTHMGVASCASGVCHGSVRPRTGTSVLQNEYVVWSRVDHHRIAYKTLLTDRSKSIANKLGLANAHEADICLDCHADNVPETRRGEKFLIDDGVGCEACHGGAEQYLAPHANQETSRKENVEAGLYPTDRPVARARLCLSCHMGLADKMATHEIMGAGHPRLSFELDTFGILQPAHYTVDDEYKTSKWHGSSLTTWIIGQIESARQSLRLIDGQLYADGLFPELSLFDCQACHHPMSERRWQPLERVGLPPGSVRLNDAHFVMLFAIAGVTDPDVEAQLKEQIRGLHADVADGQDLGGRMATIMTMLDRLGEESVPASGEFAPRLLEEIINLCSGGQVIDYVVAEQAVMAVDMLLSTIDKREQREDWLDRLYTTVDNEDHFSPTRFSAVIENFHHEE